MSGAPRRQRGMDASMVPTYEEMESFRIQAKATQSELRRLRARVVTLENRLSYNHNGQEGQMAGGGELLSRSNSD